MQVLPIPTYVNEFPMIMECKVIHTYEIGLHIQTYHRIGENIGKAFDIGKEPK